MTLNTFVLLMVYLAGNQPPQALAHPFPTAETCQKAGNDPIEAFKKTPSSNLTAAKLECVPVDVELPKDPNGQEANGQVPDKPIK